MDTIDNYFVGIDRIDKNNSSEQNEYKYITETLTKYTNGYGKLFNKSYFYNGPIKDGFFEGNGYIEFNNYDFDYFKDYKSYDGNFKNGEFDGDGKITYLNGNIFIGKFKNNHQNGPGKLYDKNGDLILDAVWKNGNIYSKYTHVEWFNRSENIPAIIGKMHNNTKVGPWVYFYKDGNIEKIIYYREAKQCSCKELCECDIPENKESILHFHPTGTVKSSVINFITNYSESKFSDIVSKIIVKCYIDKISYNLKKTSFNDEFLNNLNIYKIHAIPCDLSNIEKEIYVINLSSSNIPNNIASIKNNKSETKIYIKNTINAYEYIFKIEKDKNHYIIYRSGNLVYKGSLYFNTFDEYLTDNIEQKNNLTKLISLTYFFDGHGEEYETKIDTTLYNRNFPITKLVYKGKYESGILTNGIIYDKSVGNKTYEGNIKNKLAHGEGMFYDARGRVVYRGQVENGKKHGSGISYINDVIEWDGGWNNGKKHGSGKLYDTSGNLICICSYDQDNFMFAT
jgi:hypothetical protein